MSSSEKSNASKKAVANFDRRILSLKKTCFPFVDSDGETVKKERRLDASIYLGKIKIEETQLKDSEFEKLFKQ